MRLRKRTILIALAVAVSLALGALSVTAGVLAAEGSFERTLTVTGPVDLDVESGSGNITVSAGAPGRVYVKGIIKAHSFWGLGGRGAEEKVRYLVANPPIVQTGNVIRIGHIEDRELRRNLSISYELVVPQETRLTSETGSGDQKVTGIRGPVKAGTGSGDVELSSIGDEVRADTGSGSISLEGVQGAVFASTGSGDIHGTRLAGAIKADTGSGDVYLEQSAPGEVRIETGSGSVEILGVRGGLYVDTGSGDIRAEGTPQGVWKLGTGSGGINVRLPAEAAFDVEASTGSGGIYIEHPLTVQGRIDKHEIRGKVRGGGLLLAVSTGSGDIRIE